MRGLFGLVGLVLTLAVVGLVVKKQMSAVAVVPVVVPGAQGTAPLSVNAATLQQQSQQIQQQYKQAIDQAMQATRPEPDGK